MLTSCIIKKNGVIMKIGIISLGLIGGSLLKRLSKTDIELFAVTRNPQTIENAKKYTNNVSDDMNTLKNCDVVFVCSPMNKTIEILQKLEQILPEQSLVTDVCSLKKFVTQKQYKFKFIGSHPMAGTENSGFKASFEDLFEDAKWIITPDESTDPSDIEKLKNIISLTGATTLIMNADEHDEAAALISHMPMLIAQALMKTALKNENALKMASSGFRDMTRLALSNTEMAKDMIEMNSENISNCTIDLMETVKSLLNSSYEEQIKVIKNFRKDMYSKNGKNIL